MKIKLPTQVAHRPTADYFEMLASQRAAVLFPPGTLKYLLEEKPALAAIGELAADTCTDGLAETSTQEIQ